MSHCNHAEAVAEAARKDPDEWRDAGVGGDTVCPGCNVRLTYCIDCDLRHVARSFDHDDCHLSKAQSIVVCTRCGYNDVCAGGDEEGTPCADADACTYPVAWKASRKAYAPTRDCDNCKGSGRDETGDACGDCVCGSCGDEKARCLGCSDSVWDFAE